MSKLSTDFGPVENLLTKSSQYNIPKYQRRYSWQTSHVDALLEDVKRIYRARLAGDTTSTHFLGAAVIGSGHGGKPMGHTQHIVIDGQQRLITITLMLAALRATLTNDSPLSADDLEAKFLLHRTAGGEFDGLRIVPSEDDLPELMALIRDRKEPSGGSTIAKAYRRMRRVLDSGVSTVELDVDDEDEELPGVPEADDNETAGLDHEAMLAAIVFGLELVTISDVTPENAYQVFMTLNSRGLELEQVDLLRNGFFMLLPDIGEQIHDQVWKPMEARLGGRLEQFFHTDLLRQGHNIPSKQVYETAMKGLQQSDAGAEAAIRKYEASTTTYAALLRRDSVEEKFGDAPLTAEARQLLDRLHRWGATPTHPLLLESALRVGRGAANMPAFVRVCRHVESLLARRYICNIPPNDLRSTFGLMMQQLASSEGDFETEVQQLLTAPSRRFPTDEKLRASCREQDLYRPGKQKYAFEILKRLAEHLEGKECPQIRLGTGANDYSIEHVLPQDLPPSWEHHLSGIGDPGFKAWIERRHCLGNLTLTAYNSELGQKSLEEKQEFIKENLYLKLSKEVLDRSQWGKAEIDGRSGDLADVLVELYPYPENAG